MTSRSPIEFTDRQGRRVGNVVILGTHLPDDTDQPLLTDDLTGALSVIDIVHHEIHEGELYHVSYKSPDAAPVADNGTVTFLITTGTKYCHLIPLPAAGGDAEYEFLEGTTYTGGTGMVVRKKYRSLGDGDNTAVVRRDVTVTGAGTLLENDFLPGGRGGNAIGSVGGQRSEWILIPSTNYLCRLTNRAGNVQPMSLTIEWYEESTK